jgi:hypothetical protein
MTGTWTVRLVAVAERDYQEVIKRSAQDFGPLQAEVYAETLDLAIDALREKGPGVAADTVLTQMPTLD